MARKAPSGGGLKSPAGNLEDGLLLKAGWQMPADRDHPETLVLSIPRRVQNSSNKRFVDVSQFQVLNAVAEVLKSSGNLRINAIRPQLLVSNFSAHAEDPFIISFDACNLDADLKPVVAGLFLAYHKTHVQTVTR